MPSGTKATGPSSVPVVKLQALSPAREALATLSAAGPKAAV